MTFGCRIDRATASWTISRHGRRCDTSVFRGRNPAAGNGAVSPAVANALHRRRRAFACFPTDTPKGWRRSRAVRRRSAPAGVQLRDRSRRRRPRRRRAARWLGHRSPAEDGLEVRWRPRVDTPCRSGTSCGGARRRRPRRTRAKRRVPSCASTALFSVSRSDAGSSRGGAPTTPRSGALSVRAGTAACRSPAELTVHLDARRRGPDGRRLRSTRAAGGRPGDRSPAAEHRTPTGARKRRRSDRPS